MKKITFIMPTYNSAEYLERTLESLGQMIGANSEIVEALFVDDGSTDQTLMLLERTVAKDPMTYRLLKAKHGGVSKARNLGIKNAMGEYVTFIDSDDAYTANFIPVFLQQVATLPDLIWEDVRELDHSRLQRINTSTERLNLMSMVLGLTTPFIQEGIASKFYRREFLVENGLEFNEKIVVSEDTLFILEAIDKAKSIYLSDFNFYSILEEHSLSRFNEQVLGSEVAYERKVENLLSNYPIQKLKITLRIKLNGVYTLLRRYYGAKCLRGELSLRGATAGLKQMMRQQHYRESLKSGQYDRLFSKRYRVLRKLLKFRLYRLALVVDISLDKIKGSKWR